MNYPGVENRTPIFARASRTKKSPAAFCGCRRVPIWLRGHPMKRLLAGGARKSIPSALTVGEISRVTVDPLLMMGMNWFVALLLGTRAGLQFPALFQLLSPSVQTEVITAAEALPTPPSSRAGARTTSSNLLFKSA